MDACRFQVHGVREILVTSFSSLLNYVMKTEVEKPEGADFFQFLSDQIGSIAGPDQLNAWKESGGKIFKAVLHPGEFMYIPMAHFTVERVVGDNTVYGFRAASLNPQQESVENFSNLLR